MARSTCARYALRADGADAGSAADLEVIVEARLLREPHAAAELEQVAEELLDPTGLAGARVRPEEEKAGAAPGSPDEDDAGDLLADRDGQVRVAPVVLQKDVVGWLVLFDEVRFEEQRLPLGRRGSELDARALGEDRAVLLDARPQVVEDPTPQAAGLPDVDDLAAGGAEEVDSRHVRAASEPLAALCRELARRDERRELGPMVLLGHRRARRNVGMGGGRCGRRKRPVWEAGTRATSSGGPWATTCPPGVPAFWPEVDQPVGRLEHVHVMLDDDHRVPSRTKPEQHLEETVDVREVEAGRRLVEKVEGLPGRGLRELIGDLDPLGLPTRKRGRALAEPDVAQPDVDQELEARRDPSVVREERERFVHRHVEDVGDRLLLELHLEGLGVEPLPSAFLADNVNVGQEVHLVAEDPVALARLAPPSRHVEAEPAGCEPSRLRVGEAREQFPDRGHHAGVGGRVDRGVRPMGAWSMRRTRSTSSTLTDYF